jgi:hypothetical protein
MKVLADKTTNVVFFTVEDNIVVNLRESDIFIETDCGTYILDRNQSNSVVYENATLPEDFEPMVSMYDGSTWSKPE